LRRALCLQSNGKTIHLSDSSGWAVIANNQLEKKL
jgi:hypothetical protein